MAAEKEFRIYSDGFLFKMYWEGGGEMPAALKGSYTSYREAVRAGERYKANRKPKTTGRKNAKNNVRA